MPTRLYCLLPAASGIEPGEPGVRLVVIGSIASWIGEASHSRLPRDIRGAAGATLEHDRIVGTALARGVTPVPAALGDPYESESLMVDDVSKHLADIHVALRLVAGKVEMTTIIAIDQPLSSGDEPGRGRAYLEALSGRPGRATEIADRIERAMVAEFGAARRRSSGGRVALSHLVGLDRAADYRTAAGPHGGDGYRLVIDGPRAPYSFASFMPGKGVSSVPVPPSA